MLKKISDCKKTVIDESMLELIKEDPDQIWPEIVVNSLTEDAQRLQETIDLRLAKLEKAIVEQFHMPTDLDAPQGKLLKAFVRHFVMFEPRIFEQRPKLEHEILTLPKSGFKFSLNRDRRKDVLVISQAEFDSEKSTLDLTKLQDIQRITINLSKPIQTQREFKALCAVFRVSKPEFKSLEFNFTQCTNITNKSVILLLEALLPGSFSESCLELALSESEVTDEAMMRLNKGIQELPPLSRLKLNLRGRSLTDAGLSSLLIPMPSVKNYSLDLYETKKITNRRVKAFVRKTLSTLNNVKNLSLSFSYTQVTDKSLVPLLRSSNLWNLRKLKLFLGGTKITSRTLKTLGKECLVQMKKLERLDLGLYENSFGDDDISEIFVAIPMLEKLNLRLFSTKITDKALKLLAGNMLASARSLKSFTISLSGIYVTNDGAMELLRSLGEISCLVCYFEDTMVGSGFVEELLDKFLPKRIKAIKVMEIQVPKENVGDVLYERLCVCQKEVTSVKETKEGKDATEKFKKYK